MSELVKANDKVLPVINRTVIEQHRDGSVSWRGIIPMANGMFAIVHYDGDAHQFRNGNLFSEHFAENYCGFPSLAYAKRKLRAILAPLDEVTA